VIGLILGKYMARISGVTKMLTLVMRLEHDPRDTSRSALVFRRILMFLTWPFNDTYL
jgi:hypothetical protein